MALSNALHVIKPYRWNGMWVFDDASVGLAREPFVCGIPEMIDEAVRDIPHAEQGFMAIFSANPFPGAHITLEHLTEETGGNWYEWKETGRKGWLCPALLRYFPEAPRALHIQLQPLAAR
jgi:hypothetical protein